MFADDYADMENKSQKRARRQEREEAEGSEAAGKKAKKERDGAEGNGKRPRGKKSKQKKNQYQPSAPDMSTQNELGTTVENKAGCQWCSQPLDSLSYFVIRKSTPVSNKH